MARPGFETSRRFRGTRHESPYAIPTPSRPPRQRFSLGVIVVLLTGLSAAGLAGFLTFSAVVDSSEATTVPPAGAPEPDTTEADPPAEGETPEEAGADVLAANSLYSNGELAEVTCEAPDLDPDDKESMERFLHDITDCLDRAWGGHFEQAGMDFEKPQRIYWYTSGQSPCGSYPAPGVAAFYCEANKGLYLGLEDIAHNTGESDRPESYTFLLSHEYGHHVQGESGILGHLHSTRSEEKRTEKDREELTRRSELQANCLGGSFLGAAGDTLPITSAERANILDDAERRGDFDPDTRTHGSPENGSMWTAHGMDRRNPAACNTWAARDELVD
ncbi:neutral zinc metallopeptidase [Halostreptopolyspora alba]|uniref:Peptidase n=1 Tax=Halostreptopolyspora alba TaxID=2487137 RepID=A0A3N0E8B6_9ACTN|nr:peptidase [Nocardiopsaceae bacterium YIM 96095]